MVVVTFELWTGVFVNRFKLLLAAGRDRLPVTACAAVGRNKSGPAPQNGTTIATFEGTQGIPPTPSTQSQP